MTVLTRSFILLPRTTSLAMPHTIYDMSLIIIMSFLTHDTDIYQSELELTTNYYIVF